MSEIKLLFGALTGCTSHKIVHPEIALCTLPIYSNNKWLKKRAHTVKTTWPKRPHEINGKMNPTRKQVFPLLRFRSNCLFLSTCLDTGRYMHNPVPLYQVSSPYNTITKPNPRIKLKVLTSENNTYKCLWYTFSLFLGFNSKHNI